MNVEVGCSAVRERIAVLERSGCIAFFQVKLEQSKFLGVLVKWELFGTIS